MKTRTIVLSALAALGIAAAVGFAIQNGAIDCGICKEVMSTPRVSIAPPQAKAPPVARSQDQASVVLPDLTTLETNKADLTGQQDPKDGEKFVRINRHQNWVSKFFPKTYKEVCEYNRAHHGLENCNIVRAGKNPTRIYYREDLHGTPAKAHQVAKPAKQVAAASQAEKQIPLTKRPQLSRTPVTKTAPAPKASRPTSAAPAKTLERDAEGYRSYPKVGVNPYSPHRTPALDREILASRGFTEDEIREFFFLEKSGGGETRAIPVGTKFAWVVEGKGKVTEKLIATWEKPVQTGRFYELSTGKLIIVINECGNLAVPEPPPPPPTITTTSAPPPQSEPPDEKTGTPAPPPATPSEPPTGNPPPVVSEAPTMPKCERIDWGLIVGQRHEPTWNGADSHSTYVPVSAHCMLRYKNMWVGYGGAGKYARYNGSFGHGYGTFDGRFGPFLSPSIKIVHDNAWDAQFDAPGFGSIRDHVVMDQGREVVNRRFNAVAVSASYNEYSRKMDNKRWWYEFSVNGTFAWVTNAHIEHTYLGRQFANTSDVSHPRQYASAGARVYAYRTRVPNVPQLGEAEIYGNFGILHFDDTTGSLFVGVTAMERCAAIEAGTNFHFLHSFVPGWGYWFDIPQCIGYGRAVYREHQVKVEMKAWGVSRDPETGEISFENPSEFIESGAPQDKPSPADDSKQI